MRKAPDVYFKVLLDRLMGRDVITYEFRLPLHDFILLEPYSENVTK